MTDLLRGIKGDPRFKWNGRWLYTRSNDLAACGEISREELNTNYYGEVPSASKIFTILGFKKETEERRRETEAAYNKFSKEEKEWCFEAELRKRYGCNAKELDNILSKKAGKKIQFGSDFGNSEYDFPTSSVKNWDSLKKHVAEVLCYASPVKYQARIRSVRVSKPDEEVRAYLKNMYRIGYTFKYACQICHKGFLNVETCQIEAKPSLELDQMNLCCCPNCAAKYREMRRTKTDVDGFLRKLKILSAIEIEDNPYVEVNFGHMNIWFTQTHAAEIKELLLLKESFDASQNVSGKEGNTSLEDNIYKECLGKRIIFKGTKKGARNRHGKVVGIDGEKAEIEFDDLPGVIKKYKIAACIENGLIEIVD